MMQRKSQTQETDGPQEGVTLEKVPSSREDVFTSSLTLQEKRKLMKFLNYCLNTSGIPPVSLLYYNSNKEGTDEGESHTLEELLSRSEYSLPSSLRNIIQYAIALSSTPSIPLSPAFHAIKRHLSGFGVYGAFPIIVPLYGGGGELCQAFCRNAAVKGGTYILGRGIRECIRTEEEGEGGYKVIFDVEEGEEMSFVYCKDVVREMITEGVEGDGRGMEGGTRERGKEGSEMTKSIVIVEGVFEGLFEEGSTFTDAAVIVIPPGTVRNEQTMPIQIILHSGGIGECPPGQCTPTSPRPPFLCTANSFSGIIYSSIQASGESAHEDLSLAEKLIINHVSGDDGTLPGWDIR
jgi:Rab proteins geranylgeranyltransferase component A